MYTIREGTVAFQARSEKGTFTLTAAPILLFIISIAPTPDNSRSQPAISARLHPSPASKRQKQEVPEEIPHFSVYTPHIILLTSITAP